VQRDLARHLQRRPMTGLAPTFWVERRLRCGRRSWQPGGGCVADARRHHVESKADALLAELRAPGLRQPAATGIGSVERPASLAFMTGCRAGRPSSDRGARSSRFGDLTLLTDPEPCAPGPTGRRAGRAGTFFSAIVVNPRAPGPFPADRGSPSRRPAAAAS
jgi:hypothetical protein